MMHCPLQRQNFSRMSLSILMPLSMALDYMIKSSTNVRSVPAGLSLLILMPFSLSANSARHKHEGRQWVSLPKFPIAMEKKNSFGVPFEKVEELMHY